MPGNGTRIAWDRTWLRDGRAAVECFNQSASSVIWNSARSEWQFINGPRGVNCLDDPGHASACLIGRFFLLCPRIIGGVGRIMNLFLTEGATVLPFAHSIVFWDEWEVSVSDRLFILQATEWINQSSSSSLFFCTHLPRTYLHITTVRTSRT
jgi:hypothetical protein